MSTDPYFLFLNVSNIVEHLSGAVNGDVNPSLPSRKSLLHPFLLIDSC